MIPEQKESQEPDLYQRLAQARWAEQIAEKQPNQDSTKGSTLTTDPSLSPDNESDTPVDSSPDAITEQDTSPQESTPLQINERGLSLRGLRRSWHNRRAHKLRAKRDVLTEDARVWSETPRNVSANYEVSTEPFDPTGGFTTAHRMKREEISAANAAKAKKAAEEIAKKPKVRTKIQGLGAERATLRMDHIKRREEAPHTLHDIYHDVDLHSKEAVDEYIRTHRLTGTEIKSLKQASRITRKAERSISRIEKRIERSAEGEDLPGRYLRRRIASTNRRLVRHERRLARLNEHAIEQVTRPYDQLEEPDDEYATANTEPDTPITETPPPPRSGRYSREEREQGIV